MVLFELRPDTDSSVALGLRGARALAGQTPHHNSRGNPQSMNQSNRLTSSAIEPHVGGVMATDKEEEAM